MGLALAGGAVNYGFFDGAVTGKGLSAAAPHGSSLELVHENMPVFMDYTGVYDGYITDMTRIFVIGTLDPELKRAFDVSIEIQNSLQSLLKPGAICEELFLKSAEMAANAGLGEYYMGMPGENARFVGHGVGLELDEFPVLAQGFKMPLVAGNVIAIEPKFVIPGKGVIGIENTFAVTSAGGEKITDIPDEITYL
jgi:prepilin-type processing-associated H-X9-DG protein